MSRSAGGGRGSLRPAHPGSCGVSSAPHVTGLFRRPFGERLGIAPSVSSSLPLPPAPALPPRAARSGSPACPACPACPALPRLATGLSSFFTWRARLPPASSEFLLFFPPRPVLSFCLCWSSFPPRRHTRGAPQARLVPQDRRACPHLHAGGGAAVSQWKGEEETQGNPAGRLQMPPSCVLREVFTSHLARTVLVWDSLCASSQRHDLLSCSLAICWCPLSLGGHARVFCGPLCSLPPWAASSPTRKNVEATALGPLSPVGRRPLPALLLYRDRDPDQDASCTPHHEVGCVPPAALATPGLALESGVQRVAPWQPHGWGSRGFARGARFSWVHARGRPANEAGLVC